MFPPFLLGLAMDSMLLAETAILLHLEPVRAVLLVLHGVVVALFALSAGQGDFHSHLSSAPPFNGLFSLPRACRPYPEKRHKKISLQNEV